MSFQVRFVSRGEERRFTLMEVMSSERRFVRLSEAFRYLCWRVYPREVRYTCSGMRRMTGIEEKGRRTKSQLSFAFSMEAVVSSPSIDELASSDSCKSRPRENRVEEATADEQLAEEKHGKREGRVSSDSRAQSWRLIATHKGAP